MQNTWKILKIIPKDDEWTIKFVYSEPKVAKTKVSDFDILDINGRDILQSHYWMNPDIHSWYQLIKCMAVYSWKIKVKDSVLSIQFMS